MNFMKNKLDDEFKKLIQEQVDIAKTALAEANRLAKETGNYLAETTYFYDNVTDEEFEMVDLSDLTKELDKAGWNTSSMSC